MAQVHDGPYNPDEWEECKETPFLWWWRILATMSTVILAAWFYYYVEQNKKRNVADRQHAIKRHIKEEDEDKVEYKLRKDDKSEIRQNGAHVDDDVLSSLRRRVVVTETKTSSYKQSEPSVVTHITTIEKSSSGDNKNDHHKKDDDDQHRFDEEVTVSKVSTLLGTSISNGSTKIIVNDDGHGFSGRKEEDDNGPTSDSYEIINVVKNTTVSSKLKQEEHEHSSEDGFEQVDIVRQYRYDGVSANAPSLSHNSRDGLTVNVTYEPTVEMKKTPPIFVSEIKIKSAEENGRQESEEEETTNSILEVANVQSIEEMLLKVETLEAITEIMRKAGLESSNLIFGIDYTASNKYQGEESFNGNSLHSLENGVINPYQHVISILGKTLAPFASSGFIAAYGFGDIKTSDTDVFSLKADGNCESFAEVLQVYNEITPNVILSGPTNFAPLIYQAMNVCKQAKDYHILVIVADGQVTNEKATRRAIVDACRFPLSIIVVGVGDGPWEMMRIFDESLPKRKWDNFHFVEFHKVTAKAENPDLAFAIQALVEIPDQFKKIKSLGLLDFSQEDANEE